MILDGRMEDILKQSDEEAAGGVLKLITHCKFVQKLGGGG